MESTIIEKAFSKGFIQWAWRNKVSAEYASYIRNWRIDNGSITVRKWHLTQIVDNTWTRCRGITANEQQGNLMIAKNSKLWKADTDIETWTEIDSIWDDSDATFLNYGKYTMILKADETPYYYDGTTFAQITDWTDIDTWEKPTIGTVFSGFTVIVSSIDKNKIIFSQPIVSTDQARCWKWKTADGHKSERITARSEVLGILWTLNNMFVWTKDSVEYMDKNSINSINGTAALYLNVMGEWDQLLSPKIPVSANDLAFYITKDFVVKSIGYVSWTTNTTIWELSDRELLNIKWFLETDLNADQTESFGFRNGNVIQRHLKSADSLINDIVLIYDITNDSWLCDNNKYFQSMVKFDTKIYAGSILNSTIFRDNIWYDDDWSWIPFEYKTQRMSFGNPVTDKNFQGFEIAWEINSLTSLNIDILLDDSTINSLNIDWSEYSTDLWDNAIGDAPVWWDPIWWNLASSDMTHFEKVADHWQVMLDGKSILLYIYGEEIWQRFYLDYLSFFVKGRVNSYELRDKF